MSKTLLELDQNSRHRQQREQRLGRSEDASRGDVDAGAVLPVVLVPRPVKRCRRQIGSEHNALPHLLSPRGNARSAAAAVLAEVDDLC
jgi:hypothetical protein